MLVGGAWTTAQGDESFINTTAVKEACSAVQMLQFAALLSCGKIMRKMYWL